MGYQPPSKNTPPSSFLPRLSLDLQTVQVPLFMESPYILVLRSFSSFNPSYLLKLTKFLVQISQFEFLVMAEQSILVYKLFCHSIFQILLYFLSENYNPLKKVTHSSPAIPSKKRSCQALPFLKIW